jgi:hypothetical protein
MLVTFGGTLLYGGMRMTVLCVRSMTVLCVRSMTVRKVNDCA